MTDRDSTRINNFISIQLYIRAFSAENPEPEQQRKAPFQQGGGVNAQRAPCVTQPPQRTADEHSPDTRGHLDAPFPLAAPSFLLSSPLLSIKAAVPRAHTRPYASTCCYMNPHGLHSPRLYLQIGSPTHLEHSVKPEAPEPWPWYSELARVSGVTCLIIIGFLIDILMVEWLFQIN